MWFKRHSTPDINAADPSRRCAAIDAGAVGQNALRRLLTHDAEASVRRAAAKRLNDLVLLRATFESDRDHSVRESARARYRQLLAGGDGLDMAYRHAALQACQDQQIIAHVARSAREPELRALAIERISEIRLLREVAEHDPDRHIADKARARLAWLSDQRQ